MALTKSLGGSGGGGGAPTTPEYLTGASDATLSAERVVTDTTTVAWDLTTAGQAKANVPNGSLALAKLSATGTPSSSNFLRGDNTWAAPSGRTLIASNVLGAATGSVTFSSIPGTYADLLLLCLVRGTNASTTVNIRLRFNGDTGSNYDYSDENRTGSAQGVAAAFLQVGSAPGSTAPATTAAAFEIPIPRYADTTWHKTTRCNSFVKFGTAGGNLLMQAAGGIWRSTAAITSVTVLPSAGNWDIGSAFYLYGLP